MENLYLIILAGIIAVVYSYFLSNQIVSSSPGNSKMQEIAEAIQIGAKAYLNRQYKTIAIVGVVVLIIISYFFSILVGLGYLIGALLSGVAGYVGMLISVKANVRTAEASRKSLQSGLTMAFKSGAITGLLVAGLALLAISLYYWALLAFNVDSRELINALINSFHLIPIGGVIAVVTFHSIEDKIVKFFFKHYSEERNSSRYMPNEEVSEKCFKIIDKKPILPGLKEISQNPPSRSAKLRYGIEINHKCNFNDLREKFKYLTDVEELK